MTHPNTIFKPIGRCIYCGKDGAHVKLSTEHIIPLSLGGTFLLPESSCGQCADTTKRFEQVCARDMFWAYRLVGDLPSRKKKDRPFTLPINTHSGPRTAREVLSLPIDQYPFASFVMPEIDIPGMLLGSPSTNVFTVVPRMLELVRSTEVAEAVKTDNNQFEYERPLRMAEFARLLAKIAHGYAVAKLGYGTFEPLLPPLILGHSPNLPDFVGGLSLLAPNYPRHYGVEGERTTHLIQHSLNLQDMTAANGTIYLTAVVNLLQSVTPTYRVVVAKLSG